MSNILTTINTIIDCNGLNKRDRRRPTYHKKMYLMTQLRRYDVKLKFIADMFNTDHSSVITALNRYKELKSMNDQQLENDIEKIKNILSKEVGVVEFSIIFDVENAVTMHDFELIRKRVENGVYMELKHIQRKTQK